jgi:protein required for attachment to host cells
MNTVWIVVCNAIRARIFASMDPSAEWQMISAFDHPEGRESDASLSRDNAGSRSPPGSSVHHNSLSPRTTPKNVGVASFARTIVDALDQGVRSRQFGHLVIVAPPHLLGILRKALTPELKKHLLSTVAKDFAHTSAHELASLLRTEAAVPLGARDVVDANERHGGQSHRAALTHRVTQP